MFNLIKTNGKARRGTFETVHGTIQTPFFMNVATSAAITGGVSASDLQDLKCQVMLCNTYHLHVRTGDEKIKQLELELVKYKEFCVNLKKQNEILKLELSKSNNKLSRLKSLLKDI